MNYGIYTLIITLLLSISIIINAISIGRLSKLVNNSIKIDSMQTEIITKIVNNQRK